MCVSNLKYWYQPQKSSLVWAIKQTLDSIRKLRFSLRVLKDLSASGV